MDQRRPVHISRETDKSKETYKQIKRDCTDQKRPADKCTTGDLSTYQKRLMKRSREKYTQIKRDWKNQKRPVNK